MSNDIYVLIISYLIVKIEKIPSNAFGNMGEVAIMLCSKANIGV